MNKLINCLLPLLAPVYLQAQQAGSFTITGHVSKVKVPVMYLTYYNGGTVIDSAQVVNQTYVFRNKVGNGTIALLSSAAPDELPDGNNTAVVFVAPGESSIVTHNGTIRQATIAGSLANQQYSRLKKMLLAFSHKKDSLQTAVANARYAGNTATEARLQQQLDEWNSSKQDSTYGQFLLAHPGSPVGVYAFNRYYQVNPKAEPAKVKAVFATLPDSIRNAVSGLAFQEKLKTAETFTQSVTEGKPAPDFTMSDTVGNPVKLSSFRGKYVLLDFWASWCQPCRAENPAVVKAYQQYHSKGFEILGVSLDQPGARARWTKAIQEDGLTWTQVSDLRYWNSEVVKLYGIQGIPQNFLINPEGIIVARSLRGEALENALAGIYKN